ncbi:MAG: ABC transporter ATP-binding protein [Myxococcota bacterium]
MSEPHAPAWAATVCARVGAFSLDVSLHGSSGVVAVIGPNGSGKTTLLRALAGALDVDSAEVVVEGVVLEHTQRGVRVPIQARRVGYVPQGYGLFAHLDVADNVAFGLSAGAHRVARVERRRRAMSMLEELGCAELGDRRVGELSGGERQRVALARALVIQPRVLLLDEPLAALDVSVRRAVRAFLAERLERIHAPCVLVTHDVRDVEALAQRVVVLEAGRVAQVGTLEELRSAPANGFVEEFVSA